jgi:hypothetical protein
LSPANLAPTATESQQKFFQKSSKQATGETISMIFEILEPEFLLPRLRMQCKKGALSAVKKEVTEDQSLFPRGHHHELASQLLPSIAANGKNLT